MQFLCPRIRLTKTDGGKAILPVDAITGIEEDERSRCVKVNTIDGFSYDVVNGIIEIDKKVDDAVARANASAPSVAPDIAPVRVHLPEEQKSYANEKVNTIKKKRMLSAGVEKPERRVAALEQAGTAEVTAPPTENVKTERNTEKGPDDGTGDAREMQ